MADDTPDRGRIRTGETVLSVVEALATEGGAGVTTVADRLGIAKSTAHAHLQTLLDQRFVVKRDGQYHVGLRFLGLGQSAKAPWNAYGFIEEKVEELAEESQMRAQFLVEEHDEAVYVYRSTGRHSVPTDSHVGVRIPLHSVAAGKAMLAHLPEERVEEIVDSQGLERLTGNTVTDRSTSRRRPIAKFSSGSPSFRSYSTPDRNVGAVGAASWIRASSDSVTAPISRRN